MKKNYTYNPEDLEDLLLHKSFDELLESEQDFVLQHIDSIQEYRELRNTLLSIKDYTQNNEQIIAEPKVKKELLELFEKEEKRAFWYLNFNTIGAFLFPKNTPIFRKPIFQMATFAVLAFFVINLGFNLTENKNENLAINKIKSNNEFKKIENSPNKSIIITEPLQQIEKPILKREDKTKQPIVESNLKTIQIEEYAMEDSELIANGTTVVNANAYNFTFKKNNFGGKALMDSTAVLDFKNVTENQISNIGLNKNTEGFFQEIKTKDENIAKNTRDELKELAYKTQVKALEADQKLSYDIQKTTNSSFTLNDVTVIKTEKRVNISLGKKSLSGIVANDDYGYNEINTNSQSLENNEDIIDLLYITM